MKTFQMNECNVVRDQSGTTCFVVVFRRNLALVGSEVDLELNQQGFKCCNEFEPKLVVNGWE